MTRLDDDIEHKLSILACSKYHLLPESWHCPACGYGKIEILQHMKVKPRTKSIPRAVHLHHNHAVDGISLICDVLQVSGHNLETILSGWSRTFICAPCNGRDNSMLKLKAAGEEDADILSLASFSPLDIGRVLQIDADRGSDAAAFYARSRFQEMRPDLLRIMALQEQIVDMLFENATDSDLAGYLKSFQKTGFQGFERHPRRDVLVSGIDISSFLGARQRPYKHPMRDLVMGLVEPGMRMPDFFEACDEIGIEVRPVLFANGVLKKINYGINGIYHETFGEPTKLLIAGISYNRVRDEASVRARARD